MMVKRIVLSSEETKKRRTRKKNIQLTEARRGNGQGRSVHFKGFVFICFFSTKKDWKKTTEKSLH